MNTAIQQILKRCDQPFESNLPIYHLRLVNRSILSYLYTIDFFSPFNSFFSRCQSREECLSYNLYLTVVDILDFGQISFWSLVATNRDIQ